jgi:acetyl esterase/lipase
MLRTVALLTCLSIPANHCEAHERESSDDLLAAREREVSDDEEEEEDDAEGTLERMAYEDLPEAVRKQARREFPEQRLMAVERSRDDGRVIYHVMFEVDGTEAGLRLNSRGEILDRWHFEDATFPPTHADIKYGPHDRNVLDLWLAESEEPTPLLICIHGGGFSGGDKSGFHGEDDLIEPMLEAGISVAAINYRLTEGGKNPYPIPMHDGARAVQYLRHHADKYNLDKKRFGATGGSAGGCMLMWLGFHPDMSQPDHKDPVLRESSRLQALAPFAGQSCLHIPTLEKWFGVASLTEHPAYRPLFGLPADGPIESLDRFDAAMRDASPITHLTADDPPIYLRYEENRAVSDGSAPGIWVHHRILGTKLKEAMDALKVECHVEYPGGASISEYSSQHEFIIRKLAR